MSVTKVGDFVVDVMYEVVSWRCDLILNGSNPVLFLSPASLAGHFLRSAAIYMDILMSINEFLCCRGHSTKLEVVLCYRNLSFNC